jgi:group I intron endonuclease
MVGIYKITNPKGRIYIGQSLDIKRRWKNDYLTNRCKGQPRLYYSFRKYGVDSHLFEIVEQCDIDLLNSKERYWQELHGVTGRRGLNCKLQSTDEKKGKHSATTIKKMKKPKSAEHVAKIAASKKGNSFSIAKVTCPHCGKQGGSNGMKRYHFNKCKNLTGETKHKAYPITEQHRDSINKAIKGVPKPKGQCLVCSKFMNKGNLSRHLINCRLKSC